jgi:small subunit ribosomal protein S20
MANIKSQIKRNETNEAARKLNNQAKSAVRTAIKKVETLAAAKNKAEASKALVEATSLLDELKQKGTISANSANRKKSRLAKLVNDIK